MTPSIPPVPLSFKSEMGSFSNPENHETSRGASFRNLNSRESLRSASFWNPIREENGVWSLLAITTKAKRRVARLFAIQTDPKNRVECHFVIQKEEENDETPLFEESVEGAKDVNELQSAVEWRRIVCSRARPDKSSDDVPKISRPPL